MQMKQELRQIYSDLSSGKLSQKEALDKIKAIKLRKQGTRTGALLAAPVWQASSSTSFPATSNTEYSEHHVIACELPEVDAERLGSLLPHSRCRSLHTGEEKNKNIAQRYSEYALACFELSQTILRGKLQSRVLVQVIVADHQEQTLLAGLSGLLKTATLENPQLLGQLILTTPAITAEELAQRL